MRKSLHGFSARTLKNPKVLPSGHLLSTIRLVTTPNINILLRKPMILNPGGQFFDQQRPNSVK